MPGRAWTNREIERAEALWAKNMSLSAIGRTLGRTADAIAQLAYANRDRFPSRHRTARDAEVREDVKRMLAAKVPIRKIAKVYGIGTKTVERIKKETRTVYINGKGWI